MVCDLCRRRECILHVGGMWLLWLQGGLWLMVSKMAAEIPLIFMPFYIVWAASPIKRWSLFRLVLHLGGPASSFDHQNVAEVMSHFWGQTSRTLTPSDKLPEGDLLPPWEEAQSRLLNVGRPHGERSHMEENQGALCDRWHNVLWMRPSWNVQPQSSQTSQLHEEQKWAIPAEGRPAKIANQQNHEP